MNIGSKKSILARILTATLLIICCLGPFLSGDMEAAASCKGNDAPAQTGSETPDSDTPDSETSDSDTPDYGDFDYLVQPYGGFGPGADVKYDDEGDPISVNGYPVRSARAGFSNQGELRNFDTYFIEYPFWKKATKYDGNLACMSLALSLSANRNLLKEDDDDENTDLAGELERFLSDSGFEAIKKYDYTGETSDKTLGTAIGHRTMKHEGEDPFTLIAIGTCGANYSNEWQSNIDIGTGKYHSGFAYASRLVMDRLDEYIKENQIDGHVKIWISGISRAAAVANLTAGRLVETGAYPKEDVFAYTFATPAVTRELPKEKYDNIQNILDPMDAVTQIPPAGWGYKRYGQDHFLQVQEFVSLYGSMATGIRDEMNETDWNVENNYSPELNLRMRLMLSMLFETIGSSEYYMENVYPPVVSLMRDGSLRNMLRVLRVVMLQHRKADSRLRAYIDDLVDYVIYTVKAAETRQGFNSADRNTGNLVMRLLAEHTQNTYLANIVMIRGGLFANSDHFYYVMVRGPVTVDITWMNEWPEGSAFRITPDGKKEIPEEARKTLGDGFTRMLSDSLYAERAGDTTILAIPMDDEQYRVNWTSESAGTVQCLQVRCDTDVSINYQVNRSIAQTVNKGDSGLAFESREDGSLLPADFEKVNLSGIEIVDFMGIMSPLLNWRFMITVLCLVIGLALFAIAFVILRLIMRRRLGLPLWAILCLLLVSMVESIMSFWFMADMPMIQILWVGVTILSLVALLLLARRRKSRPREDAQ